MTPFALTLLALAMSTDAFAAALGKGVALQKPRFVDALKIGLIFGAVEACTPILGWLLGSVASNWLAQWAPWLAFIILLVLGVHLIRNGLSEDPSEETNTQPQSKKLLVLTAVATSIDALVVGFGLALVNVSIWQAALAIGLATATMATIGVLVGRVLGAVVGQRAEVLGGVVLIGVGVSIALAPFLA